MYAVSPISPVSIGSMAEGVYESIYQKEQEEQAQKERIITQTSKLVR